MSTKPTEHILNNDEDVLFFSHNFLYHNGKRIQNRKSIEDIAKKYNIAIHHHKGDKCKRFKYPVDEIHIYDAKSTGLNNIFFSHMRNAFAHCYIELSGTRCRVLDWNPYLSNHKFKTGSITLIGDVDYTTLKQLTNEFFSDKSLINKTKK